MSQDSSAEWQKLEQAIAALESQRDTLGDAVVDASVTALREKLTLLAKSTEQQRKLVTVLFADVSDFTAMSEDMDHEDVTILMNALWTKLDKTILDHGGLIDKHIGDAVMALWGAGKAQENDPERAIHAALAMQAELAAFRESREVSLAMRIGINTGPVLLGEVGTKGEFTAIGDTVNIASRLEHAAPVNSILITHDTFQHVRGVFDVGTPAPIAVKGRSEPLQVYTVNGAKPRAFRTRRRGVEGVETRMIGRDVEFQKLKAAFADVIDGGDLKTFTIVGDAGLGKSRLLYEFETWLDLPSQDVFLFKGRARQEAQGMPYGLLRDLFGFRFQISESDDLATVREKFAKGMKAALVSDDDIEMKTHFVGQILGYDFLDSPHLQGVRDDLQQLRDRAWIYIAEYFKALSQHSPAVLLLEDLHWADSSSLNTLARLTASLRHQSILILATTRPEFYEQQPAWMENYPFHTRLDLQMLSKAASCQLVEEVLQKAIEIPTDLEDLLVEHAEGNPFYLEEMVKMLVDAGVIQKIGLQWQIQMDRLADLHVPATLTGVLQARLDRLSNSERIVIQQAAVVGRVFWEAVLAYLNSKEAGGLESRTIKTYLAALHEKELVFPRENSSFANTAELFFKHTLLQEVTYESVLKRVRHRYHATVAQWLIAKSGEREAEYAGWIANHLLLSGQEAEALPYLQQAGKKAADTYAHQEALAYYTRALELVPKKDVETRWRLHASRERIAEILGKRDLQATELTLLEQLSKTLGGVQQVETALRRAVFRRVAGDFQGARDVSEQALALAHEIGDRRLEGRAQRILGNIFFTWGDYQQAIAYHERALALAKEAGDQQGEANALGNLGAAYQRLSDYQGALVNYEHALAIFIELGDRQGEGWLLGNLGITYDYLGDALEALEYRKRALALAQEIGDRRWEGIHLGNLGTAYQNLGDMQQALACQKQALSVAQEVGDREWEGNLLGNIGNVFMHLGDYQHAILYHEEALALAMKIGDRRVEGYFLNSLCEALTHSGQPKAAVEKGQQAVRLRIELRVPQLVMESRATLAYAQLAQGNNQEARDLVALVLEYIDTGNSMDGTEFPIRIYMTCYHVLAAVQDPRANEMFETAHKLLQEQAAKIPEEFRTSFLVNIPWHREVVALAEKESPPKKGVRGGVHPHAHLF